MNSIVSVTHEDQTILFHSILNDFISKSWINGEFYEKSLLLKIQSLQLNGTYVDCGAHHGNHSLFFDKFCNSTNVVSIEGNPINYEYLKKNIEINKTKKIIPIHKIVSDDEHVKKAMSVSMRNTGGSKVVSEISSNPDRIITYNTTQTLDTMLKPFNDICLIKMDLEGYECKALHGSKKIIEKYYPVIILEIQEKSPRKDEMLHFLTSYGYTTDQVNYASTPTFIFMKK